MWLKALSGGGQTPARRLGSNNCQPPEAQHTPHTKFSLCVHKQTPSTLWWSCPEEFWWVHCTDRLSFATVKSIGHPFFKLVLFWTVLKCIPVILGSHIKTESQSLSCAGALLHACRLLCVFRFLSCVYLYRNRVGGSLRKTGRWWKLQFGGMTECVWSSSKEVQMKRPPEGRDPPPLSLAPHFLVPSVRNLLGRGA